MSRWNEVTELLADVCRDPLSLVATRYQFEDLSDLYRWFDAGDLVWVLDGRSTVGVFWVDDEANVRRLTGPDGLTALSAAWVASVGSIPGPGTPRELAEAIRTLTVHPSGFVGSRRHWENNRQILREWVPDGNPARETAFESFCREPTFQTDRSAGNWGLGFFFFTPAGGVERWAAQGTSQRVTAAVPSMAAPDRTFRWPYA